LLAHGWWFSPGTPAFSTTKTGHHDIAESGVKHNKSNQIKQNQWTNSSEGSDPTVEKLGLISVQQYLI